MSRWWLLPTCAGSFWAGVLLGGTPARPAWWAAAAGAACSVAAISSRRAAQAGSDELLRAAGLLEPPTLPDARHRILAAANMAGTGARPPPVPWRPARVVALVVGAALLGGWWVGFRAAIRPPLEGLDGRFIGFHGAAAGDAGTSGFGWSVEVVLDRVELDDRTRATDLRAWLQGYGRPPRVEAGMSVAGSGTIEAVDEGSGFADYLRSRGVVATLSADEITVLGPPSNPMLRAANAARGALRRGAARVFPSREAGLLLGLAIGDTSRMDAEVEEDFQATGLGHLLAVSGANVAMFLAPVLGLVGILRVGRWGRLGVGVGAVAFFVLLTRWEPSVLRAGAMAGLALVGAWSGRPRSTAGLLGAAVLALLIADPGLGVSLGFQLSVAATVGLAAVAGPVGDRLRWLPRPVALAVAATVAAQLAVTPLLLLRFGVVPTVTVLANTLAFPAVPLALFGGVAAAALALMSPFLGWAVGGLARLPLVYLEGVADRTARLTLPALTASSPWVPAAVTAVILLLMWRIRRGRSPRGAAVAIVVLTVAAWSSAPGAGSPPVLTVTFLDVGQGDAAVVRTPDGGTVLIDAGPEPDQVAVDLAALGVRRIDLAVATHAHADHVEGFPAVLARYPVGLMIEPGCPGDSPSYRRFLDAVAAEEVPVRHPRGGQDLEVGQLVIDVLGPDQCFGNGPNDDSLVLRLSYTGSTVLFPGDAEVPAQEDLLEDGDPITAEVLKVPHHGGDTSAPEFLDGTDAVVGVVSTGPNDYGHPVPSVLAGLRSLGMRVLRTDLAGDVTVRFESDGLLVESERG